MCMGHGHSSHGIEGRGHTHRSRLWLGLGSQFETRSVGPRSSIDDSSLVVFTHAGRSRCVGSVISGICDFVCLSLCIHALKVKRLELSAPNFVHILYGRTSVVRSKGQKSRSPGFEVCCRRWYRGLHVDTTA